MAHGVPGLLSVHTSSTVSPQCPTSPTRIHQKSSFTIPSEVREPTQVPNGVESNCSYSGVQA